MSPGFDYIIIGAGSSGTVITARLSEDPAWRDHTLEEVGRQFSVTRERIREIAAKAQRKLKHPSRTRKMRIFLDQ